MMHQAHKLKLVTAAVTYLFAELFKSGGGKNRSSNFKKLARFGFCDISGHKESHEKLQNLQNLFRVANRRAQEPTLDSGRRIKQL